jgi:hypothetical protein
MILRPGALLGLPEGVPDAVFDVVGLRYALVLLALVWAASLLRARGLTVLGAGLLFTGVAVGFWVLALGRPYGLFVDPAITRAAAEVSVVAASGSRAETFLAGEAARATPAVLLATLGLPAPLLILLPSLLPPVFLAAVAVLVYATFPDRAEAPLAASLWLAFSTGDLETLRGMGIVPGSWSHPGAAAATLALLLAALLPLAAAWRVAVVAAAGLVLLHPVLLGQPPTRLGLAPSCLLLTLDQGAWLALAAWGLWRGTWVVARVLVVAGAVLVLAAVAWPIDPWGGHALYRLGLLLAACGPVGVLARRAGEAMAAAWPALSRLGDAHRLGLAALAVAFVPGSFLAWWNPVRLDPVAEASVYPHSSRIAAVMEWIRQRTPKDAVFLAPPEYGPDVAVLAGRRVLRAPLLGEAGDEVRRQRVERQLMAATGPAEKVHLYNLRWVLLPPSGFPEHGLRGPEDLETRSGFAVRYAADEFRIYELTP